MDMLSRAVSAAMSHPGLRIKTALTHYRDGLITGSECRAIMRHALRRYHPR